MGGNDSLRRFRERRSSQRSSSTHSRASELGVPTGPVCHPLGGSSPRAALYSDGSDVDAVAGFPAYSETEGCVRLSAPAKDKAVQLHAEYWDSLLDGAASEARRTRADIVSASHVEAADRRLRVSHGHFVSRAINTAGTLLTGAGLGQFYATVSAAEPTTLGYVVAFVSTVVGAVAMTATLRR